MRIKGLLRSFRWVRSRLQAGLGPDELKRLREHVISVVRSVEQICARHGVTPDHLPGPSRRVYAFLKQVEAGHLPASEPAGIGGVPQPAVALRNVRRLADHFADRFWDQLPLLAGSPDARKQLQTDIGRDVTAIEGICARQNAPLSALETPSRQVYCWLKFLTDDENLAAHLDALGRAKTVLKDFPRTSPLPVIVHLLNLGVLWRKRQYSNLILVKVSEGFLNAEPPVWQALLKETLSGRDPDSTGCVREFAASEDFTEVLSELESLAEPPDAPAQGCVHDLETSFARVNAAYFGGVMARPRLVWNRALTGRKFGHYRQATDTVMLSVSLDAAGVPPWVVDFVMYHELLHKKHGITLVNGRRFAHTAAFRAEERLFVEYEQAERFLKDLAAEH